MRGVPARERLKAVLDYARRNIAPLVGVADYPPRLKIEPRRDLNHAHARARPQRLDNDVEDDGLSDPHGKHHQRPAREIVGVGVARKAIGNNVGRDGQCKRQYQLKRNKLAADVQRSDNLVADQAHVDQNAQRGEPLARLGIGACRAHEHNARDARRQLERQLAGGLDKATEQAGQVEQRTRNLVIEKRPNEQTKGQDNRDNGDIFLIDVSEHTFLSVG